MNEQMKERKEKRKTKRKRKKEKKKLMSFELIPLAMVMIACTWDKRLL